MNRPGSGSSVVSSMTSFTIGGGFSAYAASSYAASTYGGRRAGSVCGRSVRLGGLSAIPSESGSAGSTRAPSVIGGHRGGRPSVGRRLRPLSGSSMRSTRTAIPGASVVALGSIAELDTRDLSRKTGSVAFDSAKESQSELEDLDGPHFEAPYELPIAIAPIERPIDGPEGKGVNDGVLNRQLHAAPAVAAAEAPPVDVSLEQKLSYLRSLQFVRELQMPNEMLTQVADWLEVQTFERYRVISEEASWCHSFFILAYGVAEVQELGVGVQQAPLEPGSSWGESALAPELCKLPFIYSVVAVEPCVLLVLRQSKLRQKLCELVPFMRTDWLEESERVHRMNVTMVTLWRLRTLRRVRRLRALAPQQLQELNTLLTFKLLEDSTVLQRRGQPVDTLVVVLHGEVAIHGGAAQSPRLQRVVSSRSDVPLLGVDALDALSTAASQLNFPQTQLPSKSLLPSNHSQLRGPRESVSAPSGGASLDLAFAEGASPGGDVSPTTAVTKGVTCAVLVCPLAELAEHAPLLRALAQAFSNETPRGLMARLQPRPPAGSQSARAASHRFSRPPSPSEYAGSDVGSYRFPWMR